jgi:hypothetical protein
VEGKNCDKKKIILFWATLANFLTKCLYELSPNCYVKVAVVIMTSAIDDLVIRSSKAKPHAPRTAHKKKSERHGEKLEKADQSSCKAQSTQAMHTSPAAQDECNEWLWLGKPSPDHGGLPI